MNQSSPEPFSVISIADGSSIPLYLIPFDKDGTCSGPDTLEAMCQQCTQGNYTDIHIYSHGWNNVFKEALDHYTEFFTGYFDIRRSAGLSGTNYRPLIIGVIWPSTALVSAEEGAPDFAGNYSALPHPAARKGGLDTVAELAGELQSGSRSRFFELVNQNRYLTRPEAVELAHLLLPIIMRDAADGEGIRQQVSPEKLVKAWEQTTISVDRTNEGNPGTLADDEPEVAKRAARTAGFLDLFDPKEIIRKATVFLMKDRAGTVGMRGIGPVLSRLLAETTARIHLVGHSFGAKVVLSALALNEHPRKVASVLLLQPAINAFCFAPSIPENDGKPGAFRPALERSELPVFSTFSSCDLPLTRFFHIALRRDGDLGELRPAAGPPSKFAALGGFGPAGMRCGESKTVAMLGQPDRYDLSDPSIRLYALDGSDQRITGHGDVRNEYTEWAMVNLVSGKELR